MTIEGIILTSKNRVLTDSEISALLCALKSVQKKVVPNHPLIKYIDENFPVVNKMTEPLTDAQATKIVNDFDKEAIKEVLSNMANKKTLLKEYVSTNLTLRNWMKRQPHGGLKLNNTGLGQAEASRKGLI